MENKSFVKLHAVVDTALNLDLDTLCFNEAWNAYVSNGERLPETRLQAIYQGVMEHPDFSRREKEAYLISGLYYSERYGWDFSFPRRESVLLAMESTTFEEWLHEVGSNQNAYEAFQEQVIGGEL